MDIIMDTVVTVLTLHTEILKNSELKLLYDIYPEKFNNKQTVSHSVVGSCMPTHAFPHYLDEILW